MLFKLVESVLLEKSWYEVKSGNNLVGYAELPDDESDAKNKVIGILSNMSNSGNVSKKNRLMKGITKHNAKLTDISVKKLNSYEDVPFENRHMIITDLDSMERGYKYNRDIIDAIKSDRNIESGNYVIHHTDGFEGNRDAENYIVFVGNSRVSANAIHDIIHLFPESNEMFNDDGTKSTNLCTAYTFTRNSSGVVSHKRKVRLILEIQ